MSSIDWWVLQHLPMFAIINDAVFVVHGGLFHDVDVTLTELAQIPRADYTLLDMPESGTELLEPFPRSRPPV